MKLFAKILFVTSLLAHTALAQTAGKVTDTADQPIKTARVLVRSSISEQLPRVRADRSSLGQALLNLLASAIDQTPIGGSVILSAQAEEDGGESLEAQRAPLDFRAFCIWTP